MNNSQLNCGTCPARKWCVVETAQGSPECRRELNKLPPQARHPVDIVNHPPHYNGNTHCMDAITEAIKDLEGEEAFLTGQVIKYMWRWKKKNGIEDLKKAQWYLNRLIGKPDEA